MRQEKGSDPRHVLCETKFFTVRPQPLEDFIWGLNLSRIAERVFWVHWQDGHRRGDWLSEIPISMVAARCHCDESSVTRAYQLLRHHRLIRRQSAGRNPANPFREGVAITEVRLPEEEMGRMLGSPSRRRPAAASTTPKGPPAEKLIAAEAEQPSDVRAQIDARYGRDAMSKIHEKFLPQEQPAWFEAMRGAQEGRAVPFIAATDTRVDKLELAYLREILERLRAQVIAERRAVLQPAKPHPRTQHRISAFDLAYLRKQLSRFLSGDALSARFREIAWSVDCGALHRFPVRLAINIAVKKCREAQWTRPNKMPPNWTYAAAGSESCGAA